MKNEKRSDRRKRDLFAHREELEEHGVQFRGCWSSRNDRSPDQYDNIHGCNVWFGDEDNRMVVNGITYHWITDGNNRSEVIELYLALPLNAVAEDEAAFLRDYAAFCKDWLKRHEERKRKEGA